MKITRNGVNKLVETELDMANKEFPLFHSDHEGVGVIGEEMYELREDMRLLEEAVYRLQVAVFKDADDKKKQTYASRVTLLATEAACEAIQVAAMGYKFNGSMIERGEENV